MASNFYQKVGKDSKPLDELYATASANDIESKYIDSALLFSLSNLSFSDTSTTGQDLQFISKTALGDFVPDDDQEDDDQEVKYIKGSEALPLVWRRDLPIPVIQARVGAGLPYATVTRLVGTNNYGNSYNENDPPKKLYLRWNNDEGCCQYAIGNYDNNISGNYDIPSWTNIQPAATSVYLALQSAGGGGAGGWWADGGIGGAGGEGGSFAIVRLKLKKTAKFESEGYKFKTNYIAVGFYNGHVLRYGCGGDPGFPSALTPSACLGGAGNDIEVTFNYSGIDGDGNIIGGVASILSLFRIYGGLGGGKASESDGGNRAPNSRAEHYKIFVNESTIDFMDIWSDSLEGQPGGYGAGAATDEAASAGTKMSEKAKFIDGVHKPIYVRKSGYTYGWGGSVRKGGNDQYKSGGGGGASALSYIDPGDKSHKGYGGGGAGGYSWNYSSTAAIGARGKPGYIALLATY